MVAQGEEHLGIEQTKSFKIPCQATS